MLVAVDLIKEICDFFSTDIKYMNLKRENVKIVTDAIQEQIIENILKEKARNIATARLLINRVIKTDIISSENKSLLVKLGAVLKEYDDVFIKSYVDYSSELDAFMKGPFKNLLEDLFKRKEFNYCKDLHNARSIFVQWKKKF